MRFTLQSLRNLRTTAMKAPFRGLYSAMYCLSLPSRLRTWEKENRPIMAGMTSMPWDSG